MSWIEKMISHSEKYKYVWWLYWLSVAAAVIAFFAYKSNIFLGFFWVAFAGAMATTFWRCPNCGKSVGFKTFGIFLSGVPGVRKCVHCSYNLVASKQEP